MRMNSTILRYCLIQHFLERIGHHKRGRSSDPFITTVKNAYASSRPKCHLSGVCTGQSKAERSIRQSEIRRGLSSIAGLVGLHLLRERVRSRPKQGLDDAAKAKEFESATKISESVLARQQLTISTKELESLGRNHSDAIHYIPEHIHVAPRQRLSSAS